MISIVIDGFEIDDMDFDAGPVCRELVLHTNNFNEREYVLIADWDGRSDYDVPVCKYVYREPQCRRTCGAPKCTRLLPFSTCST